MEHEIDGWIEQLSQCKPLSEGDVKKLCDKVRPDRSMLARLFCFSIRKERCLIAIFLYRQERF